MSIHSVNPFRWVLELLDQLDELESAALGIYVVAVILAGFATHAYEQITSLLILVVVGSILALPGSLIIRALLGLFSDLFDRLFS